VDPKTRAPGRPPHGTDVVVVGSKKLSLSVEIWAALGSPVYMIKDRHVPTGELHLVPSSAEDPTSRTVEYPGPNARRKRVRLTLSARERLSMRPGMYPAEVAVVLNRPVVIIKGVLS
jgi:hypothetical protein